MKKILVTTISYVNDKRPGSEIYTTYAKRLINDVLTKTPYDIMVSTNRSDLFEEFNGVEMVCIKQVELVDHKTHVGAFNQLLKFSALQCIDSEYDWVLYLDCDAGFTEPVDFNEIDRYLAFLDSEDYDMSALRTDATYDLSREEFLKTTDFNSHPRPLFNNKFIFYGVQEEFSGAKLPSEHILLLKNNDKLPIMADVFESLCYIFETQDPSKIITYDMEAFEIGVSAHVAGYKVAEMTWSRQTDLFKVGFNANNWEKIKL